MLAYLFDIFFKKYNLGLQNNSLTIFNMSDKIESMVKKLNFWKSCIQNHHPNVFETLYSFLSVNELKQSKAVKCIMTFLKELKMSFR